MSGGRRRSGKRRAPERHAGEAVPPIAGAELLDATQAAKAIGLGERPLGPARFGFVTGAFEAEGLKVGFEISQEAQSLVQLRAPLVPPVGEARPDIEVIFDLAARLGLGERFFGGSVEAGWAHQLAPAGVTLEQLRADPAGVCLPLETRHWKYAVAPRSSHWGRRASGVRRQARRFRMSERAG